MIGKGPQTFSTVFTRIAGDFGLVAQNPLTENGLLFMIFSSSAVPVWDLIKTRIIKLFERKHWLRIYRSVKNYSLGTESRKKSYAKHFGYKLATGLILKKN